MNELDQFFLVEFDTRSLADLLEFTDLGKSVLFLTHVVIVAESAINSLPLVSQFVRELSMEVGSLIE